MSDLGERLERMGLAQYLDAFVSEGFDSWETILDITESDLNTLNVKLGHRRKLQRAIAEFRGQSADRPLFSLLNSAASGDAQDRSDDSPPESRVRQVESSAPGAPTTITSTAATTTKRKYRRHPRPDEHAPDRPPSAYVIFSNLEVRETLKGQDLSFTEIAKVVGERWQVLAPEAREQCERQANMAKEKYYAEMAEYKKTPEYEAYQKYLEEFKAKHGTAPLKESKRSKLEGEANASSNADSVSRPFVRRISTVQADTAAGYQSDYNSPTGSGRLATATYYPSKSASPATHPATLLNSPRTADPYSPPSASPRSTIPQRETSYDLQPSTLGRDPMSNADTGMTLPSPAYGQPHGIPSASPSSNIALSHYQSTPIDLPSRRSFREPTRLPLLTHEETTLSSEGSSGAHSKHSISGHSSYFPPMDPERLMRVLPQPVPSKGLSTSSLDHTRTNNPSPPPHLNYQSSSLEALVRAGELARVADDEEAELQQQHPP